MAMLDGAWPPHGVDHRDGDPANNRERNLRPATGSQNKANTGTYKCNKLGVKGVYRSGNGYQAQITKDGKRICLGTFTDLTTAMIAYNFAALEHHGKFARPDPEFILAAKQYLALRNLANFEYARAA